MGVDTQQEMVWHNDGHSITLQINKSALEITEIHCPHDGNGECHHHDTPCVVKWFLQNYGLECNVGVVKPSETLVLAWAYVGEKHTELTTTQVWVIPVDDEAFSAWMVTQS